jgi:hypothetical protein
MYCVIDSDGNLNIIGVVDNNGKVRVAVNVGLNVTNKHLLPRLQQLSKSQHPYAPFKFVIGPEQSVASNAFITNMKQNPVLITIF